MNRKSILHVACVIVLLALLAGCGPAEPVVGSFAGEIGGSDAFFAIVSSGAGVMAYFTDGQAGAPATQEGWFRGPVADNEVDLTNGNGDTLIGRLSGDSFSGTLTPAGGEKREVAAAAVTRPAGLYRTDPTIGGEAAVGGWIVLPNGQQRGNLRIADSSAVTSALDTASSTATTGDGKTLSPEWVDPLNDPVLWIEPDPEP